MEKHLLAGILAACCLFCVDGRTQSLPDEFRIVPVSGKVCELSDSVDLSSPLGAYLSFIRLTAAGRQGDCRSVTSSDVRPLCPPEDAPVREMPQQERERLLNMPCEEVIHYKDSVAAVVVRYSSDFHMIGVVHFEDGKWFKAIEMLAPSVERARQLFADRAETQLQTLRKMPLLRESPPDPAVLASYLGKHGRQPLRFLLDALRDRPLVLYGDRHKHRASWEFLKEAVRDPKFARRTGIVFMELPSRTRPLFDGGYEEMFSPAAGTFENNYDGYIFLEPLAEEDAGYVLCDLYSDEFVAEIRRRAPLYGERALWGVPIGQLTREAVVSAIKNTLDGRKAWPGIRL